MELKRDIFAPWTITHYKMARHSRAETACFEWVYDNAVAYHKESLDEMLSDLKTYMRILYTNGKSPVKETIAFSKSIGATIWGTGEIDHYQILVKNSRGTVVMIINEPIGCQRGKGLFKDLKHELC